MPGISPNLAFIAEIFQPGFRLIDPEQLNLVFSYLMPSIRTVTIPGDVDIEDSDHTIILNKTIGEATNVYLQPIPVVNTRLQIKDGKGDATINNITVYGNGNLIDGNATSIIGANYGSLNLVFNGTEWNVFGAGSSSGGGGDITSQQTVSSGSIATAILNQIVVFNSASGVAKTVNVPTSTGSLAVIEIVDAFGDAYTNPITFTPASGTVIGNSVGTNQVYTNYASGRWRDTLGGWAHV